MIRSLRYLFLCALFLEMITESEAQPKRPPSHIDSEHTAWIARTLQSIQTIKVGMTRADLIKVFTTEGGLSTASQRTYVYHQCPYIKVDVKFAVSSPGKESPSDKIVEISSPYLAWSVMD